MDTLHETITRKQHEAASRMNEILDGAEKEQRELTAEENENLRQFNEDFDRYQAQGRDILSYRDKLKVTDALHEQIERSNIERTSVDLERRTMTDWEFGDLPTEKYAFRAINAQWRDNPSAVRYSFLSPVTIPLGAGAAEVRALQSAGGSAVETTFADFVAVYERTLNPMMQISTVLQTRTGAPIVVPRVTADGAAGSTVTAEAAGITEGDPTISSITLNAYKRAKTTLWSAELGQDEVIGLNTILSKTLARAIGLAWGTAFTTGNDSDEANGFITAGTNGGTAAGTALNTAADTFFAWTDLEDLIVGLPSPYLANASWVVATTALGKMRKFRDSTNAPLWRQPLVAGGPESYNGYPVYQNPAMAAVASATKSVAVGDFGEYVIRTVSPDRVDVSHEYKFNTDQLAIRYITRRDGDLPDVAAIRYLVSANT